MRAIRFEPEARQEFLAAIDWYEERGPGLGARFLASLDSALENIQHAPKAYPVALGGSRRHSEARCKRLDDFPYTVVYLVRPDEIRVLPSPTVGDAPATGTIAVTEVLSDSVSSDRGPLTNHSARAA